jgi:hypothetical protein
MKAVDRGLALPRTIVLYCITTIIHKEGSRQTFFAVFCEKSNKKPAAAGFKRFEPVSISLLQALS